MKFSVRAKLILAVLLLLTLGLKLFWTRDGPAPDNGLFVASVEANLRAQGYATTRVVRRFATLVEGRKGACRLLAGEYPPDGVFAEPLAVEGRAVGPFHYIWAGETFTQPPKFRPLVEFYLKRELGRLGFRPARRPILAVAAGPGCAGVPVDWTPLASLPR